MMSDPTTYDDSDGLTPRERGNERLLASAEDARKDVRDPYNAAECLMLEQSLTDHRLSDQGRLTARMRADFLLSLMPDHVRVKVRSLIHPPRVAPTAPAADGETPAAAPDAARQG